MTARPLARSILLQAWPIFVGQVAVMAYAVVDTVMTGHASPADLAAMGLAGSLYATVFVSLMGVLNALNPIIAQHYGAGDLQAIGRDTVQGFWLCGILTLFGMPWMVFSELWLPWVEAAPEVKSLVAQYLRVVGFALPATLLFRVFYALNTAVSRPKVIMAMQLIGLVLKVGLNEVLIFGRWGLPRLGAVGCATASFIVYWLLFFMAWSYTRFTPHYRRFAIHRAWPQWSALKELLRLGVFMGLSYALEVTSFTLMAVVLARLGTVVLGGHQIATNLAATCYMAPMALSVATATLTAQALGAGDRAQARRTAFAGLCIVAVVATVMVTAIWLLREHLVGWYTSDAAVAAMALSLLVYIVGFHFFDAVQTLAGFVLRAYKIAVVPTIIYGVALWGLGLVGGYFVAFYPVLGEPRGAPGMWLMQAVALGVAAVLLIGFYLWVLKQEHPAPKPAERTE